MKRFLCTRPFTLNDAAGRPCRRVDIGETVSLTKDRTEYAAYLVGRDCMSEIVETMTRTAPEDRSVRRTRKLKARRSDNGN